MADWERYSKPAATKRYSNPAGMIRNGEIVRLSDEVIAFWDGKSSGTRDTIQKAKAAGKSVRVFQPSGWKPQPQGKLSYRQGGTYQRRKRQGR